MRRVPKAKKGSSGKTTSREYDARHYRAPSASTKLNGLVLPFILMPPNFYAQGDGAIGDAPLGVVGLKIVFARPEQIVEVLVRRRIAKDLPLNVACAVEAPG